MCAGDHGSNRDNAEQRYGNGGDAGQGSQHDSYPDGRSTNSGVQSAQMNPTGAASGSSHVVPVGVVAGQRPSEAWGQAGGGSGLGSGGHPNGLSQQQGQNGNADGAQRGSQNGGQYKGSGSTGGTGYTEQQYNQGLPQDQVPGQGQGQEQEQNSGWEQGQRQPQDEGQRQGTGPGQTQGQGQHQPQDSEPKVAYPKGEVYGYRMALWLEHLGGKYDPVYDQPHSLACVKRVNYLAEQNWLQFSGEEDCDMTGHLITFPIIVDRSGAVSARTVNGQFSDIENSIKGKKQPIPAIFLN